MTEYNSRVMEAFNQRLRDLDRGGVTDLVYTTVMNARTGETGYIDGDGNEVTQEQYDAQATARATIDVIPEMIVEQILEE